MVNIKKELIIGIIGSAIILFLTYLFILQYQNQNKISNTPVKGAQTQLSKGITLNVEEVAKHNNQSDCWIIINDSVYAVSDYLNLHPGGSSRIIPFCGADATSAYETKDGQGSHSASANEILATYKIGGLNQTINKINKPAISGGPTAAARPTTATGINQNVLLTTAEIAKHNTQSDCWIIVSGNVYNVTNYLGVHPGGADRIIPYCGADATTAFQTKGGQGSHSATADQALASLIIGSLNQTVSVGTANQTSPAPIINSGREREEEDDD